MAMSFLRNSFATRMEEGESLDGTLPDISLAGAQRRAKLGREVLDVLAKVDDESLPHEIALTSKLLHYYASCWAKDEERYWHAIDVNGVFFYGPFAQTAYTGGFLLNYVSRVLADFRFTKEGDGERYLVILADLVRLLRQIHERTAGQAERGIRINRPQIPGVRGFLTAMRDNAAATYPVHASRLSALDDSDAIAAAIRTRVEKKVTPAFDALIEQLDSEYERLAPAEVGMDKLPGGKEVYEELVRVNTTRELTPLQVHEAGHARMTRIQAELANLREQLGFDGDAKDFMAFVRAQPGAVATSAEDIGAKMRKHKDRIDARFDEFFSTRPANEFDLERLPKTLEASMTWGYYQPPSALEKRGIYFYNGTNLESQAVFAAASLVFHELVPGHHLHLTLQAANDYLPPLRKRPMVTAYNEAWAEYAATLTGEMGLYDDPFDRFGRLIMDSFLTCRLVVDTGMNALGWTWQQAKDYMREHTMCAEGEIESDTLRYSCGIPAQSLTYKLGDEDLLRMRQSVRDRVGESFDLRDFHSAVLGPGALPMPVLEWHLGRVFQAA